MRKNHCILWEHQHCTDSTITIMRAERLSLLCMLIICSHNYTEHTALQMMRNSILKNRVSSQEEILSSKKKRKNEKTKHQAQVMDVQVLCEILLQCLEPLTNFTEKYMFRHHTLEPVAFIVALGTDYSHHPCTNFMLV